MRYLFFYIECANCDDGKGKICTFGYILCNSDFCELESDDIIINPDAPFHLKGRRDKRDISLSYSEEVFLSAPKLPYFWDRIISFLHQDDTQVWGYATINDINFLLAESNRYGLAFPDLVYYDAQALYADYKSVKDVMGLERAVGEQGVTVGDEHNSLDDARFTMIVAKSVCESMGLNLCDIVPLSPRVKGRVIGGEKSQDHTPKKAIYDKLKQELYSRKVEFGTLDIETVKQNRDKSFHVYSKERRILHNYVTNDTKSSTIGELLKGITFDEE